MSDMINFGIDLGTTNSVIAKFVKGDVIIFKDPLTWKDTLPSVVSFRKDKIIVGQKAKEYFEKSSKNVIASFKRKMGTSEAFKIKSLNKSITPIELSAYVLKELKTFVQSKEEIDSAIITIPASFDTIQSNATKEAGIMAGFKQVVLLQEPIAASLAYANMKKSKELKNGKWLVYDLGGGTFDIALIEIKSGEMKIIDHEGNNFLGGSDFDLLIVEKIVIPYLEKNFNFDNLEQKMKSASGKYNSKFYTILHKAEEAKIILSSRSSAEIEFEIEDENGEDHEILITITRSEFEALIKESIENTIQMTKEILTRNTLTSNDIQFILMVGGSTYIPYIRKRVEEVLQIPVNCEIDPTTAVAIGAAHYAGTKKKEYKIADIQKNIESNLTIKVAYQKATNDLEEFFAAKIEGDVEGLFYRIIREDGGFDTGLKPLKNKISEDLPLVKDSYNFFNMKIYDEHNNIVPVDIETIGIAQGRYSIAGQPLPNDICLEVDDYNTNRTRLELIFPKNSILPLKRTLTKTINKTIIKGSNDFVRINVLEGPYSSLPEANKSIGFLQINGKQISKDLIKGSDIELTFEISESRDLTISAYLTMTDQEFKEVFSPIKRHVPIDELNEQILELSEKIEEEIDIATELENYEVAKELNKLKEEINSLNVQSVVLSSDDVTDKRYQIEDKKCEIAQKVYIVTKDKELELIKNEYFSVKQECKEIVMEYGNDYEKKKFSDIIKQEEVFLTSESTVKIRELIDKLEALMWSIRWRIPEFLIDIFKWLVSERPKLNDQEQAKSLIEAGKFAIKSENYDRLSEVIDGLIKLLPKTEQEDFKKRIGFF